MKEKFHLYKKLTELFDKLYTLTNHSMTLSFYVMSLDFDNAYWFDKLIKSYLDFYKKFIELINNNKDIRLCFKEEILNQLFYLETESISHEISFGDWFDLNEYSKKICYACYPTQEIIENLILEKKINNKLEEILLKNREEIKSICVKHYIQSLFVFGSILGEKFSEQSDIDFIYEIDIENFENWKLGNYDYTDNLLSFENSLKNLLNRKIDLIPNITIQNKYLKQEIEKTKVQIYAA